MKIKTKWKTKYSIERLWEKGEVGVTHENCDIRRLHNKNDIEIGY